MITGPEADQVAAGVLGEPSAGGGYGWQLDEFADGWVVREDWMSGQPGRGGSVCVVERATGRVLAFPSSISLARIVGEYGQVAGRASVIAGEVVRLRAGGLATLRPCPAWCVQDRHFADGELADADDGYHHYGPETAVPASGRTGGLVTAATVYLTSWTCPLDAAPGAARIELILAGAETDTYSALTAAEARAVARALTKAAALMQRGQPAGAST
jgi:hypothetical protein